MLPTRPFEVPLPFGVLTSEVFRLRLGHGRESIIGASSTVLSLEETRLVTLSVETLDDLVRGTVRPRNLLRDRRSPNVRRDCGRFDLGTCP